MNIETRKLQLIERLAKLQDEYLLAKIEKLVRETHIQQYQQILGDGSEASLINMVREGTADVKSGRVHTSEELKERFRNKK